LRYDRVVNGFAMPVRVTINNKEVAITPSEATQTFVSPEEIKKI